MPRCRTVALFALAACLFSAAAGLAQTVRLNGRVEDTDGRALKGATVVAESERTEPRLFTVATDDRGRFQIAGIPSGVWRFTVTAPGHITQIQEEDISLRGRRSIEFRLPRAAPPKPGTPGAINARQIQADLQAAEALLQGGRYDESILAYYRILARSPAVTSAYLRIGEAHRLRKDYGAAVAAYRQLLKSEPGNERAEIALAAVYREKGDAKTAEDVLRAAASRPGAGGDVFYALGEFEFDRRQWDEAAAWYEKASEAAPGWTRPLMQIGFVAAEKGDGPAVIAQMEKVIAADPRSPDAEAARKVIAQWKK